MFSDNGRTKADVDHPVPGISWHPVYLHCSQVENTNIDRFETYTLHIHYSAPVHWSHMTLKTSPPHWRRRRRWRGGRRSRWSRWRRTGGWATCWWRWPLSSSLADTQMSPSASCLRLLRSLSQFFNPKQYFVKSFTLQPEFTISYSFWVYLDSLNATLSNSWCQLDPFKSL